MTDVGMTGPIDSIIGVRVDLALERFLTQMPVRFSPAAGEAQVAGVALTLDPSTGLAIAIERILIS
jgi:calcineurin-like phosphoesterase